MSRGDSHYSRTNPEKVPRGENQGRAKLTDEQVVRMRSQFSAGKTTKAAIARENNVSESLVRAIIQRKIWTHI